MLEALSLGRAHADVRRALAVRAGADLPGVPRQAVTERFCVKLGGRDRARLVAAGPLGVVLGSRSRTTILDPDTGETRHVLPGAAWHAVTGDVVLRLRGRPPVLEAHDLWTGELLHATRLEGRSSWASVGDDLLIGCDLGDVTCWPRGTDRCAWRWIPRPARSVAHDGGEGGVVVGPGRIYLLSGRTVTCLAAPS